MVANFSDSEGVILNHCVPKSTAVKGDTYEDVLRMKFLPALIEKRPQNAAAVFFHHDNAPLHRAASVHKYFDDSSNGAPWARPGAMPRGPKWGVRILRPPKKRAQGQLPIFDFST